MPAIEASPPPRRSLNESPSKKEGKFVAKGGGFCSETRLNESPSKKEGKSGSPRIDVQSCVSPQ